MKSQSEYKVVSYASADSLIGCLSEIINLSPQNLGTKNHVKYLGEYLNHMKARTIIAEMEYIDRDYLDDYASYYVKCFGDYKRKCSRLHFFDIPITQEVFEKYLSGDDGRLAGLHSKNYLGFVVIKPLPKTFIGKTCIRPYNDSPERCYPTSKDYHAHLFGSDLKVTTLAYQEQDRVAAACATSALWSAFQKTGEIFHRSIPTPVEITKAAFTTSVTMHREMPNRGLSIEQMAHAVRKTGLDPHVITIKNERVLKAAAYAYLCAGIPVVASFDMVDATESDKKKALIGKHAVAITGYRLAADEPPSPYESGLRLRASRMCKLYVHDDQVGPHARMGFDGIDCKHPERDDFTFSISTTFCRKEGGKARAFPVHVLIPLYHKIRIPYELIESIILIFDGALLNMLHELPFPERPEWEISLITLNEYKSKLASEPPPGPYKMKALVAPMPRFIWKATAYMANKKRWDFLFDATDIEQGSLFLMPVFYQDGDGHFLSQFIKFLNVPANIADNPIIKYFSKT